MIQLNLPSQFQTDRCSVQRFSLEDAEEVFYAYASKSDATRYVSWPTHETLADTRAYLQYAIRAWHLGTDYSFSIRLRESTRLVGSIGALNDAGKLQFGYILSPSQWGRGIATEVCRHFLALLAAESEVYRIQSFVDAENIASWRVLLKCGMEEEARLPAWFRFVNQGLKPKDCILFRYPLERLKGLTRH
jgi:ribosomal-protein-alanine N-acetyltransferase